MLATVACVTAQNTAGVDHLSVAQRAFEDGKFDAALAALAQVNDGGRPTARALDLRGCIYLEQQKFDDAINSFKAAHDADADLMPPQLHIADVFLRQGKWQEARDAYETLMRRTNILTVSERTRYGVLMTYLGAKDDEGAKRALERLTFPSETGAYYHAQAAWAFAHGNKRAAEKWLRTAAEIFDSRRSAWFLRPLHDLGWISTKPPLVYLEG